MKMREINTRTPWQWVRIIVISLFMCGGMTALAAEGEAPVAEQTAVTPAETMEAAPPQTESMEAQPVAAQSDDTAPTPAAETSDAAPQPSAEPSAEEQERQTLDARVQALKKDVKALNRDLFILEEELLFPSSTQLAVFLSVDVGDYFRLDSVELKIDDKVVANHLYTQREQEALGKGGVQRLYMGNVKTGKHELVAVFNGPGPNDRDYRRATTITFEKGTGVKYLELKIMDVSKKLQPEFVVKEWE